MFLSNQGHHKYVGPLQLTVQELDGSFTHTLQVEDHSTKHEIQCHSKARKSKKKKIPLITGKEKEKKDQDTYWFHSTCPMTFPVLSLWKWGHPIHKFDWGFAGEEIDMDLVSTEQNDSPILWIRIDSAMTILRQVKIEQVNEIEICWFLDASSHLYERVWPFVRL